MPDNCRYPSLVFEFPRISFLSRSSDHMENCVLKRDSVLSRDNWVDRFPKEVTQQCHASGHKSTVSSSCWFLLHKTRAFKSKQSYFCERAQSSNERSEANVKTESETGERGPSPIFSSVQIRNDIRNPSPSTFHFSFSLFCFHGDTLYYRMELHLDVWMYMYSRQLEKGMYN